MKFKKYNIRKDCDDLWAKLVKLRDGKKCVVCTTEFELHSHHIISRTNYNLRFEQKNGLTMCFFHHFIWLKQNPMDYIKWLNEKYPGLLDWLELKRHNKAKHDYTLVKLDLENEIKKYSQGMLIGEPNK